MCEELDMNYIYEEIDIFISRVHPGSEDLLKSQYKGP